MKWSPEWPNRIKQNGLNYLSSSWSCIRSGLSTCEIVLLIELNCRHVKRKGQDRGPIKRWADKWGDEWTQWCVKWERERNRRLTWQGGLKAWQDEKRKEVKEKVRDCLNLSRLNIQRCFGMIKKGFYQKISTDHNRYINVKMLWLFFT